MVGLLKTLRDRSQCDRPVFGNPVLHVVNEVASSRHQTERHPFGKAAARRRLCAYKCFETPRCGVRIAFGHDVWRCNRTPPTSITLHGMNIPFDNTYAQLPERFFAKQEPAVLPQGSWTVV